MDRLYSTTAAGEILGGLHPNDVLTLIRDRKLAAVERTVRGKARGGRPRKFVKASELQRYIDSLPPAGSSAEELEAPTPKRRPGPAGLAKELESATRYY